MVIFIIVAVVVAIVLAYFIIDRSPFTRQLRNRVIQMDQRSRDSLKPTNPWESDYQGWETHRPN